MRNFQERVKELQSRPGLGGCLLLVDLAGNLSSTNMLLLKFFCPFLVSLLKPFQCHSSCPLEKGLCPFVAIAGADYDKRDLDTETTAQERKESIAINKSLLALKECFRFKSFAHLVLELVAKNMSIKI